MHVPGFGLLQSLRSCVSEVIQAIDNQLSKQEDLQKKKVWLITSLSDFIILSNFGYMLFPQAYSKCQEIIVCLVVRFHFLSLLHSIRSMC